MVSYSMPTFACFRDIICALHNMPILGRPAFQISKTGHNVGRVLNCREIIRRSSACTVHGAHADAYFFTTKKCSFESWCLSCWWALCPIDASAFSAHVPVSTICVCRFYFVMVDNFSSPNV